MKKMALSASSVLRLIIFQSFHLQLQFLSLVTGSHNQDFSYMESVYNATDLPLEEEYDYIVIGGGTAGCPLATTLSENYSVLLLERGTDPQSNPSVLNASELFHNLQKEDDGHTPVQRFTSEDGVKNVRGRVLGGTSMINAGFYSRADPKFLSKSGVEWDMDLVDKAYEWVEEAIVHRPSLGVWQSAVKEALLEAGVGPDNGFTLNHEIGTKFSGSTFDERGRRYGAVELLNRGDLKNLRVAVRATVERIIFSRKTSQPSAIGVIYTDSKGKSHKALVRPKGEVILSAGAIGSPQLLLISGVGPDSYLSSLHIPLVHSQPNVGKFLADNPRNNIILIVPFPLDPSSPQVVGITSDYYIESISSSLSFSPTSLPFGFFPPLSPLDLTLGMIVNKIWGPLSHGSLHLASPIDVKASPHVKFNYFSNPIDLSHCVSAIRKIGEVLKTKSMDQFKYEDLKGRKDFMFLGPSLPKNLSDDSSMEAFCRNTVTTFYHYHGGCVVGKVVDGHDFRVIGTSSLRVVDGSTFAFSPGTNPQATLMMLGRYVGVKILRERREPK